MYEDTVISEINETQVLIGAKNNYLTSTISGMQNTINAGVTGIMNYINGVIEPKLDDIEGKLDDETRFTNDTELAAHEENVIVFIISSTHI